MNDGNTPLEALFEEAPRVDGARRGRAASVTLRDSAASEHEAALMDPATKSLADALRITFRLLQLSMVALLVLFALSGSQTVYTGERAIRLVLGKVVDQDLGPGWQWSPPPPFGELVKMSSTSPTLLLEEEFWPHLSQQERGMTVEQLAGGGMGLLNPERDGSVVTADGFLAHTQWMVQYRRQSPREVHGAMHSADEARIVKAAVRRGVVHAASLLTVDELIKGTTDATRSPEMVARRVAEETLREMNAGIEIEQLSLTQRMAPRTVARDYDRPQQVQSEAKTQVERANEHRRRTLTSIAGESADLLLKQIDLYEEQLKLGQLAEASQTQARIDAIMLGQEVEIDGELTRPRIDGEVSVILAQARQYRSSVANRMRGEAAHFRAIRESYLANPAVVMNQEWTGAMQTFLKRDNVQVLLQPPFGTRVVMLNRDPTVVREQERQRMLDENKRLEEERVRQRDRQRFQQAVDPNRTRVSE